MTNTLTITAKVTHNNLGVAKVVAKGHGRQRTVPYDHAISHEANLGAAAGVLARVLISSAISGTWEEIEAGFNRAAASATRTGDNQFRMEF